MWAKEQRGFLLLLVVAGLFWTNPLSESNYKIWTVCMCVCVYVYKHLSEGITELAREQGLLGQDPTEKGSPQT